MNANKIKKISTTEIREKLKKSKFDLLTNENDFLVKSLKKAGQSSGLPEFFFQEIPLISNFSAKQNNKAISKDFKISSLNINFLLQIKKQFSYIKH